MIRTLIVDDEPIARNGIRALLAEQSDIEVVGVCEAGAEALNAIRNLRPDLVLLDVQMPDLDGFSVIAELEPEELPAVVFVTAYDEYALRAFDVNAVDYLLKPFDRERFAETLRRVRRHMRDEVNGALAARLSSLLGYVGSGAGGYRGRYLEDRFLIKERNRIKFIRRADVDWIEVVDNYVNLHVGAEAHLLRDTLTGIASKLDPSSFLRISRSNIINVQRVAELRALPNGRYRVLLNDGTSLESSRRYTKRLKEFFHLA